MDDSKEKRDFSDLTIDYQSKRKYAPPRERDTETALLDDEVSDVGVSGFRIPPEAEIRRQAGRPAGVRCVPWIIGGAVRFSTVIPVPRHGIRGKAKLRKTSFAATKRGADISPTLR